MTPDNIDTPREENILPHFPKSNESFGSYGRRMIQGDEQPEEGAAYLQEDAFIQKHMKIIMDKSADIAIHLTIEKMWGGLEMASVQNFIETGKVSGSLYLRLKELMFDFAKRWHNTAATPPQDNDAVEFDAFRAGYKYYRGLNEKVAPYDEAAEITMLKGYNEFLKSKTDNK